MMNLKTIHASLFRRVVFSADAGGKKVSASTPIVSIVMTDMDRTSFALHGFCSWLLQDIDELYEVIVCLFNDQSPRFTQLSEVGNKLCQKQIRTLKRPAFFNISAANNLGLYYARGKWVFFANSDVIYPSDYLRKVVGELRARSLYYVMGSRINLSQKITDGLKSPYLHTAIGDYDYLRNVESTPESKFWGFGSPWIIETKTAFAIGGYDPRILCYEDRDLSDRAVCYLRQQNRQTLPYAMLELFGYHLCHPPSDLYGIGSTSMEIITRRKKQIREDKTTGVCIVNNTLDDLSSLVAAMEHTEKPCVPTRHLTGLFPQLIHRIRAAIKVLIKGTL
jgi:hypothetical protein